MGYVVGPSPFIDRLALLRQIVDVWGDGALELAMAELLEDGEIRRHVRRLTRVYRSRRDVLMDELTRRFASVVSFDPPMGGTALWANVDPSLDVDEWARACRAEGVAFAFDAKPTPNVWLGFASLDERQIKDAVRRMAKGLSAVKRR